MNGFHLIELLATLVIVSILAFISVPLYTPYLVQARRMEATITLSKLAIAMEQYYIEHHTYRGATLTTLHFPNQTGKNHYQLAIRNHDNDFTLLATPHGFQAKHDLACNVLTLNSNGEKGMTGTGKVEECW
ncbi:MAG: hypothetical protein A3F42_04350 [Gammaproteobacteria bacterium RIFCSPHIGHO2_12_FULL_37_34]|nr:MAG: hypothetical protein A3F42_04350 [Gammaproteobacteria bacterium RIFCSPHIGHO2_12_FULL_37_34]